MAKIVLLGGGFNPIGLHHEKIARAIHKKTGSPVWMMPCWEHRFAKNEELIDPKHRWEMVMLHTNDCSDVMTAFDYEYRQKHSGSMYETMQSLRYSNIETEFVIAIGLDNANIIEQTWDRGDKLIQEYPFIVVAAGGEEPKTNWFWEDPHQFISANTFMHSAMIRDAIARKDHEFAASNLNPKVWEYIKKHKLYGYKP